MYDNEDYELTEDEFEFRVPVESVSFQKSEDEGEVEGKRIVKGFGSTEDPDHDGEVVLQKGLDISYLENNGFINYDHQKRIIAGAKVPIIIGYPTLVEFRKSGLWIEGELLSGRPEASEQIRLANEMWELGKSLQKSGSTRKLSYSIEGGIVRRRGTKIVKSIARHVALTHKPVNEKCSVEFFAKSFCCGKCDPQANGYDPAHACSNKIPYEEIDGGLTGFAKSMDAALSTTVGESLLRENLDRGITAILGLGMSCDHVGADGKFKGGTKGLYNHMVNCLRRDPDEARRFAVSLSKHARKHSWAHKLAEKVGIARP